MAVTKPNLKSLRTGLTPSDVQDAPGGSEHQCDPDQDDARHGRATHERHDREDR
jgi:hypothetical protein